MWTMSGSGVAKGVGMVTKLPRYLYQEENIKRRKNDRSLFLVVYRFESLYTGAARDRDLYLVPTRPLFLR